MASNPTFLLPFLGGVGVFLVACPAFAEQPLNPLEEVTVTGSRLETAISRLPTSVSVLGQDALAAQLSLSTDVLRALDVTVPGLTVSNGSRTACSTHIRGRQASFQLNGIPVNQDLRESNCNAMFQVSPYAIERIEVVRGATAVYGAGAPGGIVNLITRRASSKELEVDLVGNVRFTPDEASDTAQYDLYAGAGQKHNSWDWYGGIAWQDIAPAVSPADTYVPREELDAWSFNGSLGIEVGESGELRFTGTWYREEPGQEYAVDFGTVEPDGFSPVIPIDDNPFKSQSQSELASLFVSYDVDGLFGHRASLAGYYVEQTYRQRANFFDSSYGNDFFDSDTENERLGFRSTLARDYTLGGRTLELEYGIDYVDNRFYRPRVDPAAGGAIIGFVSPEISMDTTGLFVQAALAIGRARLVGGVRHERYAGEVGSDGYDPALPGAAVPGDIEDSDLTIYNVGLVFDLNPSMQLYGGFSQGAELTELGRAVRGINDPGRVSPEPATSNQYEIGIRAAAGAVEYSLAAYYSESDQASLLQPDESCAGEAFCPLIPLRAPQEFYGAEATFDWVVSDRVMTGGIFTYQHGEIYDEELGRYVEYSTDVLSPLRLTGFVEFSPIPAWSLRLQATYFGAMDSDTSFGPVETDSEFLADFQSSYEIGPGEVSLGVSNLLDETYVNVTNQGSFYLYRAEGREITLGYRLRY